MLIALFYRGFGAYTLLLRALVLSKMSRALKSRGILILTTPNIASLFRRLRLLLSIQPTITSNPVPLSSDTTFLIVYSLAWYWYEAYYSTANDSTCIDADPEEYLGISSFKDLMRVALKKPTKLNTLRLLATPIIKLRHGLRQLIIAVATKAREPTVQVLER